MSKIAHVHQPLGCLEWLACWTQAQKVRGSVAAATLSSDSLRQTVHTHRASVHQAAKLAAALLCNSLSNHVVSADTVLVSVLKTV